MIPALGTTPESRAFVWYDPRTARGRFVVAIGIGLVTMLALPGFSWAVRLVAGWDATAAVLLALAWWIIAPADAAETRRRAGAEDPGRSMLWGIVIASSLFSLVTAAVLLRRARTCSIEESSVLVALCLTSVACAWLLTHSAYTLRYAHLYYRDDAEGIGGLEFPAGRAPDDLDFAYFSFTIGMCYQTSDVTITSPLIRRAVLLHSLISFAYNTAILALALNLVFGLFS